MPRYLLVNRDPWNIARQKCDTSLPGAGDPPVNPGGGKEYIKTTKGGIEGPCGTQTIPNWDDWKKHNGVWGKLPRNKKRPNILDQNANFACLYVIFSTYDPGCGPYGCYSRGTCNKIRNKLNLIAGKAKNKECDCVDCAVYYVSFGINQKLNERLDGMAPSLRINNFHFLL